MFLSIGEPAKDFRAASLFILVHLMPIALLKHLLSEQLAQQISHAENSQQRSETGSEERGEGGRGGGGGVVKGAGAWRGRGVRHRRRWSRFLLWLFGCSFFRRLFNSFISLVKFSLPLLARKPPNDGQRARFEAMIPSLT